MAWSGETKSLTTTTRLNSAWHSSKTRVRPEHNILKVKDTSSFNLLEEMILHRAKEKGNHNTGYGSNRRSIANQVKFKNK